MRTPAGTALIVQLTDPHIVANARLCLNQIDTASFLRTAVETVRELTVAPDAVVITGDLVNEGRPSQYAHLRTLLAPLLADPDLPLYLLPGNHDERSALREAFPELTELGSEGPCDFAVDVGPVRLVCLDTLVDGRPGGDLAPGQLEWLADTLAAGSDQPTLLALHHPPFRTGIGHMDAMGLDELAAARLEEIVRANPQIERVMCGHLHRAISRRWAGTVVATAASVAHSVALDLRQNGPSAWNLEPPAITLHHWDGVAMVTHQRAIGEYPARRYG